MNIVESNIIYLLLASNALLVAAASIAVIRFRRQCLRLQHFWNSPTGANLAGRGTEQERQAILVNMRLERKLSELQKCLQSLSQSDHARSAPIERILPIDNAVRMAKSGASVEDLTRSCGLNIGEATLMQKIHKSSDLSLKS